MTAAIPGAKPVPFRCSVPDVAPRPRAGRHRDARRARPRAGIGPRRACRTCGLRRCESSDATMSPVVQRISSLSAPAFSSAKSGPGYATLGAGAADAQRRPGRAAARALEVRVAAEGAATLPSDASNSSCARSPRSGPAARRTGVPHAQRGAARSRVPALPARGNRRRARGIAGALRAGRHGTAELIALAAPSRGTRTTWPRRSQAASRSRSTGSHRRAARIEPPAGLAFVLVAPATSSTDGVAQAAAPEVPRADAVYSLHRAALLAHALATGELDAPPASGSPAPARPPHRSSASCRTVAALGAYG